MVLFLNAPTRPKPWQITPERRRVIVLGAGRTGLSAAYHLGEHSLLLEQRAALQDHADGYQCGELHEVRASDREWPGVFGAQRKALFISCSSSGHAHTDAPGLIHVARWEPPGLTPVSEEHCEPVMPRALLPLLRGEVRFGARAIRLSLTEHRLDLADGSGFIYDKLVCTLPLATVMRLICDDRPAHVRRDEALRYWLGAHDVEPADRLTQICHGDIDEFSAGRRLADIVNRALSAGFQGRMFEPRVVPSGMTPPPP
jgi:hypothetical protein